MFLLLYINHIWDTNAMDRNMQFHEFLLKLLNAHTVFIGFYLVDTGKRFGFRIKHFLEMPPDFVWLVAKTSHTQDANSAYLIRDLLQFNIHQEDVENYQLMEKIPRHAIKYIEDNFDAIANLKTSEDGTRVLNFVLPKNF